MSALPPEAVRLAAAHLAAGEAANAVAELCFALNAPPTGHSVSRIASVAAGLDRAAEMLRRRVLEHPLPAPAPPPPPPPAPPAVELLDAEITRLRAWIMHIEDLIPDGIDVRDAELGPLRQACHDALNTETAPT